jgi:HSP20 family protein
MTIIEEEKEMAVMRWAPFRELEDLRAQLNELVSGQKQLQTPGGRETMTVADWIPAVDITETEVEYLIKAELPEIKKEDVKLTVQDGVLTLRGERKREREEKAQRFHRMERSYGVFMRRFTLPDGVDEESLRAEFKDGMLWLHLPKSTKAQPRAVEVEIK